MKICIVTCGVGAAEPRVIKQALALRDAFPLSEITVFDVIPDAAEVSDPETFQRARLLRRRCAFATRRSDLVTWVTSKARVKVARARLDTIQTAFASCFWYSCSVTRTGAAKHAG